MKHLLQRETMASSVCGIVLLGIICINLHQGCGLPVSEHPNHIRTKRCSCNSWEDKECIYFCHLDIIWVNTPSKLLPYGLGSPRRRRSANRCECTNPTDGGCHGFCHQRSEDIPVGAMKPKIKPSNSAADKLLAALRSVVQSNTVFIKSSKKNSTFSRRLKNRTRR